MAIQSVRVRRMVELYRGAMRGERQAQLELERLYMDLSYPEKDVLIDEDAFVSDLDPNRELDWHRPEADF